MDQCVAFFLDYFFGVNLVLVTDTATVLNRKGDFEIVFVLIHAVKRQRFSRVQHVLQDIK